VQLNFILKSSKKKEIISYLTLARFYKNSATTHCGEISRRNERISRSTDRSLLITWYVLARKIKLSTKEERMNERKIIDKKTLNNAASILILAFSAY